MADDTFRSVCSPACLTLRSKAPVPLINFACTPDTSFVYTSLRETERDWDKELENDVKQECEEKYGKVLEIYVERESQVRTKIEPSLAECDADHELNLGGNLYPI